ncbi:MAG: hypothetical protein IJ724_07530, partial [Muribaculaceae bacterium]|nr:hypothetical protein [Muribaculaceae bacterium]
WSQGEKTHKVDHGGKKKEQKADFVRFYRCDYRKSGTFSVASACPVIGHSPSPLAGERQGEGLSSDNGLPRFLYRDVFLAKVKAFNIYGCYLANTTQNVNKSVKNGGKRTVPIPPPLQTGQFSAFNKWNFVILRPKTRGIL